MPDLPRQRLTRVEQTQLTRERFLVAAADVFARRGFNAARLEEIAALAGYTPPAVYKHFPSKEALFVAFFEQEWERHHAALAAAIENESGDANLLTGFGRAIVQLIIDAERWRMALIEFNTCVDDQPELRERMVPIWREHQKKALAILPRLCKSLGVEPPLPPKQLSITVEALAAGLHARALEEPELDVAGYFADALNLILAGGAPTQLVERQPARKARR